MKPAFYGVIGAALVLSACASVREVDLQSWIGHPVSELDRHPLFLTMQSVRTRAADGSEIRNYINGNMAASCSGGGAVSHGMIDMATYNTFTNCMQSFRACNNIFYISNGVVTQYTPIGTGGGLCYTDDRVRPGFSSASNF